jgi:hypothetical protein
VTAGGDSIAELFTLPPTGTPPWASADHSYAGWVPTVLGHLAFSMVGTHACSPRFHCFNRDTSDHKRRIVAVHQRRTAQDYMISGDVLRHVRRQVSHDCLILAETASAKTPFANADEAYETPDDKGVLVGVVLVIPDEKQSHIRKKRKALLGDLISSIEDEETDPNSFTANCIQRIDDARIDGVAILQLRFALFRTGELRIWFGLKDFFGREVHSGAVPPSQAELELAEALPPQTYFFVKDAAHRHYHHEPDSDQLLPLTTLTKATSEDEHRHNELRWRRETLWGLARVVSQYRRNNSLHDFKKARGVLAYADAFQSTLARVIRRPLIEADVEHHKELTVYDFAHTKASVDALEGLESWRKSGLIQLFATMIGVILSSLALWAGAVQIYPVLCDAKAKGVDQCPEISSGDTIKVVQMVAEHPLAFSGSVTIIGVFAFIWLIRDITFLPYGQKLQRLLSTLSKATGASAARRLGDFAGWVISILILAAMCGIIGWFAISRAILMLTN